MLTERVPNPSPLPPSSLPSQFRHACRALLTFPTLSLPSPSVHSYFPQRLDKIKVIDGQLVEDEEREQAKAELAG